MEEAVQTNWMDIHVNAILDSQEPTVKLVCMKCYILYNKKC